MYEEIFKMIVKTTHGHHQIVNTEIRLIIFFAARMEKLCTVTRNETRS